MRANLRAWQTSGTRARRTLVVNTSLNDKKNTFNFAEGTATQAFELPNQPGISKIYEKI